MEFLPLPDLVACLQALNSPEQGTLGWRFDK